MPNETLKSLTMPIKSGGTTTNKTYDIPQGDVKQADLEDAIEEAIEESEGKKADAIVRSASGDIASYDDGGDLPMKSLKVNIVPKQSGSGDPSPDNVRPISGTDTVNLTRCGKNVLNASALTQYKQERGVTFTVNADGSITAVGTATAQSQIYWAVPQDLAKSFAGMKLSGSPGSNLLINIELQNSPYTVFGSDTGNGATISDSIANASGNCWLFCRVPNGATVNTTFKPMIRPTAFTDSTYAPYEGETKSIALPSTVYGGTLDVVSGKLTIDTIYVDLGGQWWAHEFVNGRYRWYADTSAFAKKEMGAILCCSQFAINESPITGSGVDNTITTYSTGGTYLNCFGKDSMSNEEFKSAMSGVIAIYKVETPTEIDLTPTEVKSLLGDNNVWSDSGTVEVEYRADTSLVINKILEALA